MQTVQYGANFNLNSLYVPDVYLQVLPPQAYYSGTPSSVGFVDGTASWGAIDTPILLNTPQGYVQAYGGITAAALTDTHDLCTNLSVALQQVTGTAGVSFYAVRRTNGSDTAADVTLVDIDESPNTGITITAKYTGTLGAGIQVQIAAAAGTDLLNVTIIPFSGGGNPQVYQNLPNSGTTFWPALQSAINNGQGPSSPANNFVVASGATTTADTPALGSFFLTGGNDGRTAITTAELVGSSSAVPAQGIYAAAGLMLKPSVLWVAGLIDTTIFSTIDSFCDLNNIMSLVSLASGTSISAAATAVQTLAINDYQMCTLVGWHYIYDTVNQVTRLIAPDAACGGAITSLAPWASCMGIAIKGIIGTERTNIVSGVNQPYSYSELQQASLSGLLLVDNPTPVGNGFAFRNSCNSVGNYPQNPQSVIEYGRMTNWLAQSIGQIVAPFLGKLQGTSPGDPSRAGVNNVLNTFLSGLDNANQIGGYLVDCGLDNNSLITIANHGLLIAVQVQYLSSILLIGVTLQGGTTVQVTTVTPGQSQT